MENTGDPSEGSPPMHLTHPATFFLSALCAMPAAHAAAPNLFKCVATDGATSFQGQPCAAGTRQAWARTVVAAPAPASVARDFDTPPERKNRGPARVAANGRTNSRPGTSSPSRCDAAKARRADLRDRHWRTIGVDQLRLLDDEVWRACAHP
jgi:hypothetical protein